MNAKRAIPAFIGVASVWMGTHFGAGFASGTMLNAYFTKHGLIGVFTPILSMGIIAFAVYFATEFSRIYNVHNIGSYSTALYAPHAKIFSFFIDITFLFAVINACGAGLAAAGSLLERFWAVPYWIGIIGVIIVGVLLCMFGSELVRRTSSYMMFFVIGVMLFVIVLAFTMADPDLAGAVANNATNAADPGILSALWSSIVYASFQSACVLNISSVTETLKSKKESKYTALAGFIGNAVIIVPTIFLLYSFTNRLEVLADPLPLYSILTRLNMPWLTAIYVILVLLAVLSSIAGFVFAVVSRYRKYIKMQNEPLRDGIIGGVVLLACAFAASFGLLALVSVGFGIVGYIYLPVVVLPAIFVARHKISKKYLEAHNIQVSDAD